jgi:hypothetical protein
MELTRLQRGLMAGSAIATGIGADVTLNPEPTPGSTTASEGASWGVLGAGTLVALSPLDLSGAANRGIALAGVVASSLLLTGLVRE